MVINTFPEFGMFLITSLLLSSLLKTLAGVQEMGQLPSSRGRFFDKSPFIPLFQRGRLVVARF